MPCTLLFTKAHMGPCFMSKPHIPYNSFKLVPKGTLIICPLLRHRILKVCGIGSIAYLHTKIVIFYIIP